MMNLTVPNASRAGHDFDDGNGHAKFIKIHSNPNFGLFEAEAIGMLSDCSFSVKGRILIDKLQDFIYV